MTAAAQAERAFVAGCRKIDRGLTKIAGVHDCDPAKWTARVTTPGFAANGVGYSTGTCGTCQQMVAELFDAAIGGHEVRPRGEQ